MEYLEDKMAERYVNEEGRSWNKQMKDSLRYKRRE